MVEAAIAMREKLPEQEQHEAQRVSNECSPALSSLSCVSHNPSSQELTLETQWNVGIGGGIWTTGLLLCEYFGRNATFFSKVLYGKRIIEIGSGTGLVALSLATNALFKPQEIVITDQKDHLELIERNVCANNAKIKAPIRVQEFNWLKDEETKNTDSKVKALCAFPFDVVVGTDVAYCQELYGPVVDALCRLSGPHSLILLGVTRTDTNPSFFQLLQEEDFDYCLTPVADRESSCTVAGGFALLSVVRRVGS